MTSSKLGSPLNGPSTSTKRPRTGRIASGVRKSTVSPRLVLSPSRTPDAGLSDSPGSDSEASTCNSTSRSPSPRLSSRFRPRNARCNSSTRNQRRLNAADQKFSTAASSGAPPIRYKFRTESTSKQDIKYIYEDPIIDPATGEVTGHDSMVTKVVTVTITTTTVASTALRNHNGETSAVQADESDPKPSPCQHCSCGHLRTHEVFHTQHHRQAGVKLQEKAS